MNKKVPAAILRSFTVFTLALAAICPIKAVAQPSHYFPGTNASYTGGSNSFPLNSTSSNKCQWLYKSSDFNSAPGALLITTIYIKPSTTKSSFTFSNLTVKLGNTTLTTLSSGAWLTGLTTVYNPTSVTVSTTANQWKAITLSTPFFYSGGNLLLEISHATSSSSGISLNQYSVSGRNGRKYGSASSATASGVDAATALFGFDGVPATCSGTPAAPAITTAAMSTASPICAGSTKALTATDPNAPITNITYQWQSASSATGTFTNVTSGSGATTLNYTTGPLATTTWFRMGAKCTGSGITSYSAAYKVLVGAQQPGTIAGALTSCPGDTATYSVPFVAGHSYTWSLPSGWSGSSTTNSILVTPGPNAGTISVTATGCGGTSVARTKAITAGSAPATPGLLSGSDKVCAYSTQTYSVTPVPGAKSYTWTLPSGWTGSSTSNSITVVAGTAGGSIKVKAINGCGNSGQASKNVTIISTLANPGTITSSATGGTYCSGALYSFSINPVPGATAYTWSLPSGWAGTTTGTSIQAFAGSTGQVQVTAYVSCAASPTASLSTVVDSSVTPSLTVAPASNTLCQGQPVTFTATPLHGGTNPGYIWIKNGAAVTGSGSSYVTTSLKNGDVVTVAMTSNAQCRSLDTVISAAYTAHLTPSVTPGISINSNPVITICKGTRLNFQTIRTGFGTAPSYQWHVNGAPVPGATDTTFSSSSFANGDTLTVTMTTNATCATLPQAASNKVSITVKDTVRPDVTVYSSSVLAGQPITFSAAHNGGGETPVYQWRLNNVDIPNASEDTYNSPALIAGDRISVRLQSNAECAMPSVVTSKEVIILSPTSVGNTPHWNGVLKLYPNPNTGRFTLAATQPLSSATERISVDVYNIIGQRVFHKDLTISGSSWSQEMQLAETTPSGQYTVRITAEDGSSANVPMMLSR